MPCACDAAGAFSPSGLQRSHIDSEIGMLAPHRTHPCIGSVGAGAAGAGVVGIEVIRSLARAPVSKIRMSASPARARRPGCTERVACAERVEVRREPPDHVQDHLRMRSAFC